MDLSNKKPFFKDRNLILMLALFGILFYLHIISLNTIPLFEDDLFLAESLNEKEGNMVSKMTSYCGGHGAFFRSIGCRLLYLTHYVVSSSPLVLSVLVTLLIFCLIGLFAYIIEKMYGQSLSKINLFFPLIFFAIPFSLYVILYYLSSIFIVSTILISVCTLLLHQLSKKPSCIVLLGFVGFFYMVSLYIFEIFLLIPIYFLVLLITLSFPDNKLKFKSILILCISTLVIFSIYTFSQFYDSETHLKLATGPTFWYDPYRNELGIYEQFIRKTLLIFYHIKWSFYYLKYSFTSFKATDLILIVLFLSLSGYALWSSLSNKLAYLNKKKALIALYGGLTFTVCPVAMFSYYYLFGDGIVTPPLYDVFIPAIGISLIMLGILSLLSYQVVKYKPLKIIIFIFLLSGIFINLSIFLSSRFAIENSINEAQSYARYIDAHFGLKRTSYKYLAILGLPKETDFARYRVINFNQHLLGLLASHHKDWSSLEAVGNKIMLEKDTLILLPVNERVKANETLILGYQPNLSFNELKITNDDPIYSTEDDDPWKVSSNNYELRFSIDRGNMALIKKVKGLN